METLFRVRIGLNYWRNGGDGTVNVSAKRFTLLFFYFTYFWPKTADKFFTIPVLFSFVTLQLPGISLLP